jgi:hypothetical protein
MPWRIDRKLELRAKFFGLIDQCNDSPILTSAVMTLELESAFGADTLVYVPSSARLLALDNLAEKASIHRSISSAR